MLAEIADYWSTSIPWDRKCFLCGSDLGKKPSQEHIFPRWLQKQFGLQNMRLTLLNMTQIPYRQLTVPCCQSCNSKHLSSLERTVSQATKTGYEAFRQLDYSTMFAWTAKLLFGILYKELSLKFDRSAAGDAKILTEEYLEEYRTLHLFLQCVRWPIHFTGRPPASIFVFRMHRYTGELAFDFHDTLCALTLMIRMNDIGIIVAFEDNGIMQEVYGDLAASLRGVTLHPVQLRELAAMVSYKAALKNRVPKYVTCENVESGVIQCIPLPLQGLSSLPIFDQWDHDVYLRLYASYLTPVADMLDIEPIVENLKGPDDSTVSFLGTSDHVFEYLADGTRIS